MSAWPDRSVADLSTESKPQQGEKPSVGSTSRAAASLTLVPGGISTADEGQSETDGGSSKVTLLVVAPVATPTSNPTKAGKSKSAHSAGHRCQRCPTVIHGSNAKLCPECKKGYVQRAKPGVCRCGASKAHGRRYCDKCRDERRVAAGKHGPCKPCHHCGGDKPPEAGWSRYCGLCTPPPRKHTSSATPCACGKPKMPGRGNRYCADCCAAKAAQDAARFVCSKCGGPRTPKRGVKLFCDTCVELLHWQSEQKAKARRGRQRGACPHCQKPKLVASDGQKICKPCRDKAEYERTRCAKDGCKNKRRGGPNSYCETCYLESQQEKREQAREASKYRWKMFGHTPKGCTKRRNVTIREPRPTRVSSEPLLEAIRRQAAERDMSLHGFIEHFELPERAPKDYKDGYQVEYETADLILTKLRMFWWDVFTEPIAPATRGSASDVQSYLRTCDEYLTAVHAFDPTKYREMVMAA